MNPSQDLCNRAVSSDQYIGGPMVMTGKHAAKILFFSGRYNPESSGNPVSSRHLASYRDGRVSTFSGPTFSTISHLMQIDEDRFLGASFSFGATDLQKNSWLAEGRIVGQSLEVKPAAIGRLKIEAVSAVTSNPRVDAAVVRSADFLKPEVGYSLQLLRTLRLNRPGVFYCRANWMPIRLSWIVMQMEKFELESSQ